MGAEFHGDGQTDIFWKLIVAFSNFANVHKNEHIKQCKSNFTTASNKKRTQQTYYIYRFVCVATTSPLLQERMGQQAGQKFVRISHDIFI